MPPRSVPSCRLCQTAGVPQGVQWTCGECGGSFCERHLHRGQVKRQWSVGGARLSFTYGHACDPPKRPLGTVAPWADACDAGHNLRVPRAVTLGADGHRRCRVCADVTKKAFYEREKAAARAAGMGIKAWKRLRAETRRAL